MPYFVLKNDVHINTEYSASVMHFQYMYKYFYKGPDQANWSVQSIDETPLASGKRRPKDEITDYECGRYVSSMEGLKVT